MSPATGGSEREHRDDRDWILRCEGFRVFSPSGELVGVVTGVVYDHSARWDAPHGLRVRTQAGQDVLASLESVVDVDMRAGRLAIDLRV